MRQLKKRTIALILASVVTVVGAFGANNYKNSIMSLKFEGTTSDNISMTVLTKTNYTNTLTPVKRDANTYIIMLPETNSAMTKSPELSGNVESVDIKTMPYTTTNNGYTKITVKTTTNAMFSAKNALYVPEKEETPKISDNYTFPSKTEQSEQVPSPSMSNTVNSSSYENNYQNTRSYEPPVYNNVTKPESLQETQTDYNSNGETSADDSSNANTTQNYEEQNNTSGLPTEILYAIFGSILMITVIAYLFIRSKNKMAEILGEQGDFDVNDTSEQKQEAAKKEKQQKIKATIDSLDKMYKQPTRMPISQSLQNIPEVQNREEIVEDSNIIDLDDLFKEQKNSSNQPEQEDDIFDDFLNDFLTESREEDEAKALLEEKEKYNEELFNKFINNDSIKFSSNDIEKIDKLLNSEISDEFIKKMNKLAEVRSTNNQPNTRTLNNMVADLMISKNVMFTSEDIKALDRLMNVELDSDFVKNLRTNPNRTKEMSQEILEKENKPKPTEIITMKVKESLPNLAEELKKYKNHNFKTEARAETIYYESGYDVQTLSVNEMPDLGIEIKNPNLNNKERPSDDIIWPEEWEKTYDTPTISVSDDLPDLSDVQKHPDKYDNTKSKQKVDKKALEKNLESVVFKPFYDGEESDKIYEEEKIIENIENDNILQTSELDSETLINEKPENIDNDVPELMQPKEENEILIEPETKLEITVPTRPKKERVQDEQTKNLLNMIDSQKDKTKQTMEKPSISNISKKKEPVSKKAPSIKFCILDGVKYQIVALSSFADNIGCYLAISDEEGYSILGFIGDKIFKIKNYKRIQNPTFQTRKTEKLENGAIRYIVRIGIHKFILDVTDESMECVMDLC